MAKGGTAKGNFGPAVSVKVRALFLVSQHFFPKRCLSKDQTSIWKKI